jgi:hypothetical protein
MEKIARLLATSGRGGYEGKECIENYNKIV